MYRGEGLLLLAGNQKGRGNTCKTQQTEAEIEITAASHEDIERYVVTSSARERERGGEGRRERELGGLQIVAER